MPFGVGEALNLQWSDEAATQAFCQTLGAGLLAHPARRNAFIALHGDLGAGKTTLVRHLLRALGVLGRVRSPTYAVVEAYALPDPQASGVEWNIWHCDFYRFSDPREWADAGLRDIFASPGLKLAEWPQRVASVLPAADLDIRLVVPDSLQEQSGDAPESSPRTVTLVPHTRLGLELLT